LKRPSLILLLACALVLSIVPGISAQSGSAARVLVPGETYAIQTEEKGEWGSGSPAIAAVDGDGVITALSEGTADITLTRKGKPVYSLSVQVVAEPVVPEDIRAAIDLAIAEWEVAGGSTFKKSNKYTTWYYGPKASFGWCGAFTSYALGEAGVFQEPTDTWRSLKPLPDGLPHGVREAGVPKLLAGYTAMDRLTHIPRPGYLVVYGRRGGYKTLHVGLVTRVENRGDGVYLLETVEGNLANRIKRLTYLYDSKTADPKKNLSMLPEEERLNPDVFQYRLTDENWRVTAFLQTWY